MRLIDADKLKQHYAWWPENERTVLDQIVDAQPTVGGECIPMDWILKNTNTGMNVIEMMQAIKDAPVIAFPPIDAVPVVRCLECRWWDKIKGTQGGYCHACKHGHWSNSWEISIRRIHKEDFYCADGERKDGADNA